MRRELEELLVKRLKTDRAVAIIGPRQSGKSYLLKKFIGSYGGKYISLDDPMLRDEINRDPVYYLKSAWEKGKHLFIDEAAKAPKIFEAVKILIDECGADPSGICLANSGNYLLLKRIKETLAGRISLISLYPLSWREFAGSKNDPGLFRLGPNISEIINVPFLEIERMRNERVLWGGYPFPALSAQRDIRERWAEDYLKTYVFPIVLEQFSVRDIDAFERCARLLFAQSGKFMNYSRIAQEANISQPTALNYIHHLKAMMLFVSMERYFKNLKKRLIKQPKIYAVDPLLLQFSFGTGFNANRAREQGVYGSIYEAFVCFEIIKTLENSGTQYKIFSWRTADKAEVDMILEFGGKTYPIEIKSTQKITKKDCAGILSFLEDNPHVECGYIIYPGREILKLHPKITAIPDFWLLGAY